jgi:hypothetical protein
MRLRLNFIQQRTAQNAVLAMTRQSRKELGKMDTPKPPVIETHSLSKAYKRCKS